MRSWKKWFVGIFLIGSSLMLVGFARNPDIFFLIKKNFTIFSEVYREVSLHYVDEVDPQKLMRKGINAMLGSLDPYTVLIDEEANQNMEIITRGSYGGVGLEIGYRGDRIVVVAPMEGYSAYNQGIRSGDEIIAVDAVDMKGKSPDEVKTLTSGEPGTTVSITVKRYGIDHPLEFKLKRERVEVDNIAYTGLVGENKRVGYILLNRFSRNAAQEIQKAYKELSSQAELSGLILDLRNNPGGLLGEAVKIVGSFTPKGTMVVETRGRLEQHDNRFYTEEDPLDLDLPLAILQNGGSASASEIVAGAFQDLDRAVILGEQSFGKGLVQIIRPLSYNTSLKLTSSRYYIPSGRSIQSVTYPHDSKNSAVVKPDSSRNIFKTKNGRTVYDRDGIAPDIKVGDSHQSMLLVSLMRENMFFDFANKYASQHETLNEKKSSDELFNEFKAFVDDEGFNYSTSEEKHLAKLDSLFKEHTQSAEGHIKALKENIAKSKEQAFIDQRKQIEQKLFTSLIARYKGKKGQVAAQLPYDVMVKEALSVLTNRNRYQNILSGTK